MPCLDLPKWQDDSWCLLQVDLSILSVHSDAIGDHKSNQSLNESGDEHVSFHLASFIVAKVSYLVTCLHEAGCEGLAIELPHNLTDIPLKQNSDLLDRLLHLLR